jgi:glycosyltransferase involved in cell wall biosynthesis
VKILYLTHQYFPRHVGGTEIFLRGLALGAQAHGHEVRIVTYVESPSGDPSDYGPRKTVVDGLPVTEIHYNLSVAPDPARYEFDNAFVGAIVERELDSFAPDIVHALHTMKLSGAALAACHKKEIPVVATLCDFWFICPRHTLMKWDGSLCCGPGHDLYCAPCLQHTHGFSVEKDAAAIRARKAFLQEELLRCRRVVALSPFAKEMFIRNGYPASRIDVVSHGLDTEGLVPHTTRTETPIRVIFIGSPIHSKGPHILIDAVRGAPELDVECMFYGRINHADPYARSLRGHAGGDPRIRFCGPFPPKDLGIVLRDADLMVLPSLTYENEPLVIKAALHVGLPVITSDIGSLPGMLRGYQAGWLVPPGDVGALTRALREAIPRIRTLDPAPIRMKTIGENAAEMLALYKQERRRT